MATTQEHLPIADIREDLVILKDGSAAMVLQTSAVNFDLLSEGEQLAIISSFAGLLNSLSFIIQIVIRSKRLDISSYLETVAKAQTMQHNPLLKTMLEHYRIFISNTIRENEVLDKQFYIVIPISYLELGLAKTIRKDLQKTLTILIPRRDHIIRQLNRIGLKATQLTTEKLIKLFYDIYNNPSNEQLALSEPTTIVKVSAPVVVPQPKPQPVVVKGPTVNPRPPTQNYSTHFVVEELPE